MKKKYIAPCAEIECCLAEVMALPLGSVGQQGHVVRSDGSIVEGTVWGFAGDGNSMDDPDAKTGGNLWDGWDD